MSRPRFTLLALALPFIAASIIFLPGRGALNASQQERKPSQTGADGPQYILRTRGYPKATPLSQAVAEFNERARRTQVGKTQPPLTVEELLAAIRDWNPDEDAIEPAMFAELQRAAKSGMMPKGAYLNYNSGTLARNGYDIDAWNIYLRVGLDKYADDLVGVPAYMVLIRRQYIASRPEESLHKRSK
jgi:hypothetical protein